MTKATPPGAIQKREQSPAFDQVRSRALAALDRGDWEWAVSYLSQARDVLSLDGVEDLLQASQALKSLEIGRSALQRKDLDRAEFYLRQVLRVGHECTPARRFVHEARDLLLDEVVRLKVEGLLAQAEQAATWLLLGDAQSSLEQAKALLESLQDDPSSSMNQRVIFELLPQVKYRLEAIQMAHPVFCKYVEAQYYLTQDIRSERYIHLLSEVLGCHDQSEIIQEIKQRAISLQSGKNQLELDYESMERRLVQRVDKQHEQGKDEHALALLQWVRAQRKLDQEWDLVCNRSRDFLEGIKSELKTHSERIIKDAQIWKWLSVAAAAIALGLLVCVFSFVIRWREPLTYLSTLPAVLSGIAVPFVHKFYIQMMEQVDIQRDRAWKQLEQFEAEENQRRKAMFDTILGEAWQPPSPAGITTENRLSR